MARKQESREIKGLEYRVTVLDARKGSRLLQKIGGVLAGFALSGASVSTQVAAAMRGLEDVSEVVDDVASQAWVVDPETQGVRALATYWPEHFAGDYGALAEFTVFALEVNYANFTGDIERLMQRYTPENADVENTEA